MGKMKAEDVKRMFLAICDRLISSEEELCRLDSRIGDGDHGTTVARGFGEVKKKLEAESYSTPARICETVGHTLSVSMGGAIGPILGSFFQAGVRKLEQEGDWDIEEFQILFAKGLERIQMLGGAKEGDRTLVDALAPACYALDDACKEGLTLKQSLKKAALAAREGAEKTRYMQARKGRARFLGEKSIGFVDAGATTIALMIETMYEEAKE